MGKWSMRGIMVGFIVTVSALAPVTVSADSSVVYVVDDDYIYDVSDPIANGLWTGVNAATLGPPADSVNTKIRRACGYPSYVINTTKGTYQDIIGNGLTSGVNIATTGSAKNPGAPASCTATVVKGSNGKAARVTVHSTPSTKTYHTKTYHTGSYDNGSSAVRVTTPSGTATRVTTPDSSATWTTTTPTYDNGYTHHSFPDSSTISTSDDGYTVFNNSGSGTVTTNGTTTGTTTAYVLVPVQASCTKNRCVYTVQTAP